MAGKTIASAVSMGIHEYAVVSMAAKRIRACVAIPIAYRGEALGRVRTDAHCRRTRKSLYGSEINVVFGNHTGSVV